ncbi:hypothetical protein NDU88_008599 [Pleurodeles waltl]|uniref:RING-type domain-containing protein n=2 Tax=Pleurodeles waltl TaxID=8319 RepID=A0AAV7QP02_PLEWA|nr:hypothetical protein NDU88_008599 [Pleurodeles waltl]
MGFREQNVVRPGSTEPRTMRIGSVEIPTVQTEFTGHVTRRVVPAEQFSIRVCSAKPATPGTEFTKPSNVRMCSLEQSAVRMDTTVPITARMDSTKLPILKISSTECPSVGMGYTDVSSVNMGPAEPSALRISPAEMSSAGMSEGGPEDPLALRKRLAELPGADIKDPVSAELGSSTISVPSDGEHEHAMLSSEETYHVKMLKLPAGDAADITCHQNLPHLRISWQNNLKPQASAEGESASLNIASSKLSTPERDGLHSWRPSVPVETSTGCAKSSVTEMDCPVCFIAYDLYRLPKCLSCRHTFCNVCLKLLLRHEDGYWQIACPLCRMPTSVSGGLIRTLPNQEDILAQLENPTAISQVCPLPQKELPLMESSGCNRLDTTSSSEGLNIAARRLAALLVILVLLLVIILLFLSSGPVRWTLCAVMGLSLALSVLLCWRPQLRGCCGTVSSSQDPQERCSVPVP